MKHYDSMETYVKDATVTSLPRHRRPVDFAAHGPVMADVRNEANCRCGFDACPRHAPRAYAAMYARHAPDSI